MGRKRTHRGSNGDVVGRITPEQQKSMPQDIGKGVELLPDAIAERTVGSTVPVPAGDLAVIRAAEAEIAEVQRRFGEQMFNVLDLWASFSGLRAQALQRHAAVVQTVMQKVGLKVGAGEPEEWLYRSDRAMFERTK